MFFVKVTVSDFYPAITVNVCSPTHKYLAGKSASIQSPKAMTIWEDIRLPTTVVPTHYNVTLKIDMTNERFTGETTSNLIRKCKYCYPGFKFLLGIKIRPGR